MIERNFTTIWVLLEKQSDGSYVTMDNGAIALPVFATEKMAIDWAAKYRTKLNLEPTEIVDESVFCEWLIRAMHNSTEVIASNPTYPSEMAYKISDLIDTLVGDD